MALGRRIGWIVCFILLLGLIAGFAASNSADAQCYNNNCYKPSYSGYGYSSYGYSGYSSPSYSAWFYECWPKNHAYFYRVRWCYNGYGGKHLEHDHWLYTTYYHNGVLCYRQHCKIADYGVGVVSGFPVEKVVVREVPILVAPPVIGGTQYGGVPASVDVRYSTTFPVKVDAFGRLAQEPVTSLTELYKLKSQDDGQLIARELAMTAKYLAQASGQVAADAQQTIREKNAAEAENQRILIQGAVAENVAVKALQGVSALGSQNLIGEDGALANDGANALSIVINNKCLACHGAEKVEAGLDFTKTDDFTTAQKLKCLTAVSSGKMPKNGKALTENEVALFEAWVLGESGK